MRMSLSQLVHAFLLEHAGVPYCDDCLRTRLHISRVHMNECQMTRIAADLKLNRQPGKCSVCGVARFVTKTK